MPKKGHQLERSGVPSAERLPSDSVGLDLLGKQELLTMTGPIRWKFEHSCLEYPVPNRNTLFWGRRSLEQSPMRDGDETAIYVGAGGVAECDMHAWCVMRA